MVAINAWFDLPDDGGSPITLIEGRYAIGNQDFSDSRTVTSTRVPLRLPSSLGIEPGDRLRLQVRVRNAIDWGPLSEVLDVTVPEEVPPRLTANVFYGVPDDGGSPYIQHTIQWRQQGQSYTPANTINLSGSQIAEFTEQGQVNIPGLAIDTEYLARVQLENAVDESPFSPDVPFGTGRFIEGPFIPVPPVRDPPIPADPLEGPPVPGQVEGPPDNPLVPGDPVPGLVPGLIPGTPTPGPPVPGLVEGPPVRGDPVRRPLMVPGPFEPGPPVPGEVEGPDQPGPFMPATTFRSERREGPDVPTTRPGPPVPGVLNLAFNHPDGSLIRVPLAEYLTIARLEDSARGTFINPAFGNNLLIPGQPEVFTSGVVAGEYSWERGQVPGDRFSVEVAAGALGGGAQFPLPWDSEYTVPVGGTGFNAFPEAIAPFARVEGSGAMTFDHPDGSIIRVPLQDYLTLERLEASAQNSPDRAFADGESIPGQLEIFESSGQDQSEYSWERGIVPGDRFSVEVAGGLINRGLPWDSEYPLVEVSPRPEAIAPFRSIEVTPVAGNPIPGDPVEGPDIFVSVRNPPVRGDPVEGPDEPGLVPGPPVRGDPVPGPLVPGPFMEGPDEPGLIPSFTPGDPTPGLVPGFVPGDPVPGPTEEGPDVPGLVEGPFIPQFTPGALVPQDPREGPNVYVREVDQTP